MTTMVAGLGSCGQTTNQLLTERFRCPDDLADFVVAKDVSGDAGFFRFGSNTICYGQCSSGIPKKKVTDLLHDAGEHVVIAGSSVHLPFDPAQVVDNLRHERYEATWRSGRALPTTSVLRSIYYQLRPALGISVRKHIQKLYFRNWEKTPFPRWPVDRTVEEILEQLLVLAMKSRKIERLPFIWFWPEGAQSCSMMTHDVETAAGREFCPQMMDLDDSFGIKSSFQIVPEGRYAVSQAALAHIRERGFEINIHDLNHDGQLMFEREEFLRRAQVINRHRREFGASGFRSAVMYRNTDWYEALDFVYDMSVPNVGHLDAQQGGCCTVLPFFVGKILELPLTTTQDYSLFNILNDYSIQLWREQISLIREKHGLASFIIHPDYCIDRIPRRVYAELLHYLCEMRSQGEMWIALPGEVAAWWRLRHEMSVVKMGSSWCIKGKGSERARLAYAVMERGSIRYELPPQ
jgi:hypothetical protein